MVFPLFKSMTELLLPVKQEEKIKREKGFASQEAMYKYIKLTEQMNKRVKRRMAKRILEQSLKKRA